MRVMTLINTDTGREREREEYESKSWFSGVQFGQSQSLTQISLPFKESDE